MGKTPFSAHVFYVRKRRGDLLKLLWWDGDGLCLFAQRCSEGASAGREPSKGAAMLALAQRSMLREGLDWRRPARTGQPELAG